MESLINRNPSLLSLLVNGVAISFLLTFDRYAKVRSLPSPDDSVAMLSEGFQNAA